MSVLLTAIVIGAITLVALGFAGYGLTRLLLPAPLTREAVLWTPFVGYTLLSILCHALNVDFLDGRWTILVVFASAAVLNVIGSIFGLRLYILARPVAVLLVVATGLAFVLAVAPVLAVGQLTAVAKNYDLIDVYDATAAYIVDYPVNSILLAGPPNPLANIVVSASTLSNGWGLSYLHAAVSILTGRSVIETQVPVFGMMHALVVPSAYIFLRRTCGLAGLPALAASAVLGVHGMLLSIALVGLGNHTAILALLPVIFTATFLAMDHPRGRAVLLAAFMLTNIPLTFWAAFPFYLPPALLYLAFKVWPFVVRTAQTALRRTRRYAHAAPVPAAVAEPAISGTCRRSELVTVARFLAGLHSEGLLAISSHGTHGMLAFHAGDICSASAGGRRGVAALSTVLQRNGHLEFTFRPVLPPGLKRDGQATDGRDAWRTLEWVASEPATPDPPVTGTPASARSAILVAGVSLMGSIVLALPGYQRIATTILAQATPSQGWGQKTFVDLGLVPGLSYWVYPGPKDLREVFGAAFGGGLALAESGAVVVSLVLAAYAMTQLTPRGRAAMASLVIAYALPLFAWRFVLPYPYAYLKGLTFGALVGVPLVVLGLERLWAKARGPMRGLSVVVAGCLGGALALSTGLTLWSYADQTQTVFTGSVLPPSSLHLQDMAARIPKGATVFVSTTPPMRPEVVSAAAFFLRDHPLVGEINTLESALDNPPPGGAVADFGLLAASEDPVDRGYEAANVAWSDADVQLYARGNVVAHLAPEGRDQLAFSKGSALDLSLTPQGIYVGAPPSEIASDAAPRQLILEVGTFQPQTVHMRIGGQTRDLQLADGVSVYSTEALEVPTEIELTGDTSSAVFVRLIDLRAVTSASPFILRKPDVLVAVPKVTIDGSRTHLDLSYAGADVWLPHMAIGLNIGGNSAADGNWNDLGWWGAELPASYLDLDLDLASKQASGGAQRQNLRLNSTVGPTKDGTYAATLNFWEPAQASIGWHSPFYRLFTFEIRDGSPVSPDIVAPPVIFLPWRTTYQTAPDDMSSYAPQVVAIQNALPASPHVLLSPTLRQTPAAVAALKQGLPQAVLYADYLSAAYYPEPSHVYDDAVLSASDDPSAFGYSAADRILATDDFAVYRRGETWAHLDLGNAGHYPRIDPGGALSLYATDDSIGLRQPGVRAARLSRSRIRLTFGSLSETSVALTGAGDFERRVSLPAGVAHYMTDIASATDSIVITGVGGTPTFLLSADVIDPTSTQPPLALDPNALLVQTQVQAIDNSKIEVDLHWVGGDASRQFYVGLNLNGYALADGQWFPGAWWGLRLMSPTTHVELDLGTWEASAGTTSGPVPIARQMYNRYDGDYTAQLSLWEPALSLANWQPRFIPLFDLHSQAGQPNQISAESGTLTVVPLVSQGRNERNRES